MKHIEAEGRMPGVTMRLVYLMKARSAKLGKLLSDEVFATH
jgi:hypothetical protein